MTYFVCSEKRVDKSLSIYAFSCVLAFQKLKNIVHGFPNRYRKYLNRLTENLKRPLSVLIEYDLQIFLYPHFPCRLFHNSYSFILGRITSLSLFFLGSCNSRYDFLLEAVNTVVQLSTKSLLPYPIIVCANLKNNTIDIIVKIKYNNRKALCEKGFFKSGAPLHIIKK